MADSLHGIFAAKSMLTKAITDKSAQKRLSNGMAGENTRNVLVTYHLLSYPPNYI